MFKNWFNRQVARALRNKKLREYLHYRSIEASGVYFSPPGDYDSPMFDPAEGIAQSENLIKRSTRRDGVDLNDIGQRERLERWASYVHEYDWTREPRNDRRYYADPMFDQADSFALYCVLREFQPRRVVEIGSGFSSALMLDVNDRFFNGEIRFTFVEPFPERLNRLLNPADKTKHSVRVEQIQDSSPELADLLAPNDLFFVDSSHMFKCGGDLAFVFFHFLPRLAPGVIVHFHDIFWPFEYPLDWRRIGRPWNEVYFLRSFLQYNSEFEVLFFGDQLVQEAERETRRLAPPLFASRPGSIWLRRRPGADATLID